MRIRETINAKKATFSIISIVAILLSLIALVLYFYLSTRPPKFVPPPPVSSETESL